MIYTICPACVHLRSIGDLDRDMSRVWKTTTYMICPTCVDNDLSTCVNLTLDATTTPNSGAARAAMLRGVVSAPARQPKCLIRLLPKNITTKVVIPKMLRETYKAEVVGGGGIQFVHGRSRMTIWYRPSHPYYAETEHVGFSPTRQTLLAPSAKRRQLFGESHEG